MTTEAEAPEAPVKPEWRTIPTEELGFKLEIQRALYRHNSENAGKLKDKLDAGETFGLGAGVLIEVRNQLDQCVRDFASLEETKIWREPDDVPDTEIEPDDEPGASNAGPVGEAELIDPTTPEGLVKYDQLTAKLVSEAERKVGGLEAEWDDAHEEAKELKAKFEQARDKMRLLIREREFGRTKKPQPTVFDRPMNAAPGESRKPDALADLWQSYPIEYARWGRWGLTEKDVEILNGGETKDQGTHPILTLGDMTRFITPDRSNPAFARKLKDFKKFGDAAADRFDEAQTKFWAHWSNGGQQEFAAERGIVTDGDAPAAGVGSQGAEPGVAGDDGETAAESGPAGALIEPMPEVPEAGKKPKRKGRGKGK